MSRRALRSPLPAIPGYKVKNRWSYTFIPSNVFMAGCLSIGTNSALCLPLSIVLRIYCYLEAMRKCSVRLKQKNGGLRKATVLGKPTRLSCFLVDCCIIYIIHELYCQYFQIKNNGTREDSNTHARY